MKVAVISGALEMVVFLINEISGVMSIAINL